MQNICREKINDLHYNNNLNQDDWEIINRRG